MDLFRDGALNPGAMDEELNRGRGVLAEAQHFAVTTQSGLVETTHFLMALSTVPNGVTHRGLARRGLTPAQWQSGLASCVTPGGSPLREGPLVGVTLDSHATLMLNAARLRCRQEALEQLTEPILLLYALEHATPGVRALCAETEIDLDAWRRELEDLIAPPPALPAFTADAGQAIAVSSFSPRGRKILRLMQNEAQSLGYERIDPRHLLLALAAAEGGPTHAGLHQQGAPPRKVHEAVMLNLRGRARRTHSRLPLARPSLQPLLQHLLERAGELAGRRRAPGIGEAHLLAALLAEESTARGLLADQGVDLAALGRSVEEYDPAAEGEGEDATVADPKLVGQRLSDRLVGQNRAIEQILPYLEFLRFGLATPGHPVGVFLFCGQSGSGKTEMAKELARAVYGSEENLIFLEMGQFNAPESMNIFVGAPPGYIGYGEGKLTNGLRDKPQAVVLFDEVEKAHSKVLDALLRFLDEGRIDDPAGPVRDGARCIVVLTSNVAADDLDALWDRFEDSTNARTEIRKALRAKFAHHKFRVEFLNRVDEVILFKTLKEEDYVEIARRNLARHAQMLRADFGVEVVADEGVARLVGGYCAHLNEGARTVDRVLRAVVLLPVCRFVLNEGCTPPVILKVRAVVSGTDSGAEPIGIVERA